MGDADRLVKMEVDYSSVVDQKLKECDEIMKVNFKKSFFQKPVFICCIGPIEIKRCS